MKQTLYIIGAIAAQIVSVLFCGCTAIKENPQRSLEIRAIDNIKEGSSINKLDWKDSLSLSNISFDDRINIATRVLWNCNDGEYFRFEDTIAFRLLNSDLFDQEVKGNSQFLIDQADDRKAILMTSCGTGTMCSGTSYILYMKRDGTSTIKKVAYSVPAEEGGIIVPAQYQKIKKKGNSYELHGRFAFSSTEEVYDATKTIKLSFLESDEYLLPQE